MKLKLTESKLRKMVKEINYKMIKRSVVKKILEYISSELQSNNFNSSYEALSVIAPKIRNRFDVNLIEDYVEPYERENTKGYLIEDLSIDFRIYGYKNIDNFVDYKKNSNEAIFLFFDEFGEFELNKEIDIFTGEISDI